MLKIHFMGDITPGGVMTSTGKISDEILSFLSNADLRIATLESALGDGETKCHVKMNDPQLGNIIFSPDNSAISILKKLKIDAVSLANNHICDLDLPGLYHTIDILDQNGIKHFGAGKNKEEAEKPVFIHKNGKTICLLGYFPPQWEAPYPPSDTQGGLCHFYIDKVLSDVRTYSEQCDYLFVMPHWGLEYSRLPYISDIKYAKQIISAGATGIIGSHTHIVQPIIKYKHGIIAFSLGNFLFPDRYIIPPRQTYYPSEKELIGKDIPTTDKYPIVDRLTYKKVNPSGRVGVICTIELNGNMVKSEKHYSALTNENCLILKDEKKQVKLMLYLYGCLTKSVLVMRLYIKTISIYRRLKNKLC